MSLISKMRSATRLLIDPEFRYFYLGRFRNYYYGTESDEEYLIRRYKYVMGEHLDFSNPKTFNEKLNYLKIYDRRPEYHIYSDKYRVKAFVAQKIGHEHVIPTLKKWDSVDQINFDELPNSFVLKTNHDSGTVLICKDKKNFNQEHAKERLSKALKNDFWLSAREWCYKDIPKCIFAEPYLVDSAIEELRDYKFFCFNGEPKFFKVDFDRFIEHHANYFDFKGTLLPYGEVVCPPVPEKKIEMPTKLKDMIRFSKTLSKGIPFVRVDFYEVDGIVYFGEMTFYPNGGTHKFITPEHDLEIGNMLDLSSVGNSKK